MRPYALLPLLASLATAHFKLNNPATLGFDDDVEGTFPCGGFSISFKNTSDFPVTGAPVYLTSTHPEVDWLFRAALENDTSAWTDLLPVIKQEGLGDYCETGVKVPESWAGSNGLIQIIQDATDGMLYQCAAVKFTKSGNPSDETCKNGTSVKASYDSTTKVDVPSGNATVSGSASSASASASSTAKSAASAVTVSGGVLGAVFGVLSWALL